MTGRRKVTTKQEKLVTQHSPEAERAFLGSLLHLPEAADRFKTHVDAGHFGAEDNRKVWEAITTMRDEGTAIDLVTLADRLKGKVAAGYIAELLGATPTAANVKHYFDILQRHKVRRDLLAMLARGEDEVLSGDIEKALKSMERIAELGNIGGVEPAPFTFKEFENVLNQQPRTKIKTGYQSFDDKIVLGPGRLVVVGARTSYGKTTFALNLLHRMATRNAQGDTPLPFLFFSYETNVVELALKLACIDGSGSRFTEVYKDVMINNNFDEKILASLSRIETAGNMYLIDEPSYSVEQIRAYASEVKRRSKNLGAIFVDYIEKVRTPDRPATEELRVSEIVTGLRRISQELNVPVIALAQISRTGVGGDAESEEKEPTLAGLRYSGMQEQEADTVILLYNDVVAKRNLAETGGDTIAGLKAKIVKNRSGQVPDKILFRYAMDTGVITELEGGTDG